MGVFQSFKEKTIKASIARAKRERKALRIKAEKLRRLEVLRAELNKVKTTGLTKTQKDALKRRKKRVAQANANLKKGIKQGIQAVGLVAKAINKQLNKLDIDKGLGIKKPRKKATKKRRKKKSSFIDF